MNKNYLMMFLLVNANYKSERFEKIIVERGQYIFSYDGLSRDCGMPLQTLRTTLKDLVETNQITIKSTRKWSLLTICEYDSWQNQDDETNTQVVTQTGTQIVTQMDNNIINKEINNKEIKEEESNDSKKKLVYPQEYENDFILYGRKGSKKNGFKRWKELTEEEKVRMRLHIPYYLQSNDRQFLKDFEGYINQRMFESPVYQGSILLYDPMQREQPEGYHPLTDNCQIWEEKNQCLRIFNGDIDNLNDGYTDGNRPEGATVAWGMYSWKWSKLRKEWVKQ